MGGTVGWNGETEEVTLTYGKDEIKLTIDSTVALLNGEKQILDVAPTVMNDRTMPADSVCGGKLQIPCRMERKRTERDHHKC